ncbi:hypothetical protein L615_000800000040 [Nocardioides sp. J9]|uniref:hypothetical protein n=1 Tax=unclassified Nocardioides TaxID=2615069 RepID=UPI00048CD664|nr:MULTISPECIES: hypothetical protein [unclassified Nocardioides]TWG91494.1 hypothetical protein L615_000800000040 [Nocardioides sp. J9]
MSLITTVARGAGVVGATAGLVLLSSGIASAHECVNASKKNQAAGVQIVFGVDDDIVWVSQGLQKRIDSGKVDLETGEGFHGLIGIDVDGDSVVDFATYIVGPGSEIPLHAQERGARCSGIVNVEDYFACSAG